MTPGLLTALASGALVSFGLALLVIRIMPTEPDLADALSRLAPGNPRRPAGPSNVAPQGKERIRVAAIAAK